MKKKGSEEVGDFKRSKHENQIASLLQKMQERKKTKRLSAENNFKRTQRVIRSQQKAKKEPVSLEKDKPPVIVKKKTEKGEKQSIDKEINKDQSKTRIKAPTEKFLSFQKSMEKSNAKKIKKNDEDSSKRFSLIELKEDCSKSEKGNESRNRKPNPKYELYLSKLQKVVTQSDTEKRKSTNSLISKSSKLVKSESNLKTNDLESKKKNEEKQDDKNLSIPAKKERKEKPKEIPIDPLKDVVIEKRKRIPNSKYLNTVLKNCPGKSDDNLAKTKQSNVVEESENIIKTNSEVKKDDKKVELTSKRLRVPNKKYEVTTEPPSKAKNKDNKREISTKDENRKLVSSSEKNVVSEQKTPVKIINKETNSKDHKEILQKAEFAIKRVRVPNKKYETFTQPPPEANVKNKERKNLNEDEIRQLISSSEKEVGKEKKLPDKTSLNETKCRDKNIIKSNIVTSSRVRVPNKKFAAIDSQPKVSVEDGLNRKEDEKKQLQSSTKKVVVNSISKNSEVASKRNRVPNPKYSDSIPDKVSNLKLSKVDKLEDEICPITNGTNKPTVPSKSSRSKTPTSKFSEYKKSLEIAEKELVSEPLTKKDKSNNIVKNDENKNSKSNFSSIVPSKPKIKEVESQRKQYMDAILQSHYAKIKENQTSVPVKPREQALSQPIDPKILKRKRSESSSPPRDYIYLKVDDEISIKSPIKKKMKPAVEKEVTTNKNQVNHELSKFRKIAPKDGEKQETKETKTNEIKFYIPCHKCDTVTSSTLGRAALDIKLYF